MSDAISIADTKAGRVRGAVVDGISIFKGIRYGATTEGHRFQPPQPPANWTGVHDAREFGQRSPQWMVNLSGSSMFAALSGNRAISEDCLFLNVWTPAMRDGAKRPVMVWLHGGGFAMGESSASLYDGTRLAKRHDVVVVSLNHRLNVFGYLYLGEKAGAKYADSGNVGSLDMVLGLQWVRDNIAEFGGDPGNVTIFGESGGGAKVSVLMAMPPARGLFHKAIVQSGAVTTAASKEQALTWTEQFMRSLGLQPDEFNRLATMPAEKISAAVAADPLGIRFSPVIDGRSLPRAPFEPDAPSVSQDVPMLIGSNKDETTTISMNPNLFALTEKDLPSQIAYWLPGKDANATVAALKRLYPFARPSDLYFTVTSWAVMRRVGVMQAELKSAQRGAPAYMYVLDWESPVAGGQFKAFHGVDVPMVFDNLPLATKMTGPEEGQTQRVADAMSAASVAFARTGNPGWAPYDTTTRQTMVFNVSSKVVADPDGDERQLLWGPPYNPFLDYAARPDRPR